MINCFHNTNIKSAGEFTVQLMDKQRFAAACESVRAGIKDSGIGTLSEKSIHSVLKKYYEPQNCNHEVKVGNYIADIVGENGIIEVQTHSLFRLQKKLDVFLDYCPVTVVHPVIKERRIKWLDENGVLIRQRKSPLKQNIYDALFELYGIKYALDNPNMTVIIPVINAEDLRIRKSRTKSVYAKADKIPVSIEEELVLSCADDWRVFVPCGLEEVFTSKEFAAATGIHPKTAWYCLNILNYLGIAKKDGKRQNSILYRIRDFK